MAPLARGKCAVGRMCPPWKKTASLCPCVTRTMAVEPNCGASNVPLGNLLSGKPGSVTGGTGLNMPRPGMMTRHTTTLCISLACGSRNFFGDGLPRALRLALRERVACHQYHLLLSVMSLRGELPMPPRCTDSSVPTASISAWFGSLRHRKPQPNPTTRNLWEQVHFSPATRGSDPDTPTQKPAPGLLVTRRIKKLLTKTPTSQNRSKAVRYLTQHPGTPYTADLKAFTSLHYVHS